MDDHLGSPFLLIGTEAEIASQLRRLREVGVGGVTVFDSAAEALVPLIARSRP